MSFDKSIAYNLNPPTKAYVKRYAGIVMGNSDEQKLVRASVVSDCCRGATRVTRETPPGGSSYFVVHCIACNNACQVVDVETETEPEEPDPPGADFITEYTDEPVCPHCGHAHDLADQDGIFFNQDGASVDCEECDQPFVSFGTPRWKFNTYKEDPDERPSSI